MIKLVVFDLDNVIIDGEAIDEIGKLVNVEEQIAEITEQAMNGDLDFETSIKERVKLLKGASVDEIKKIGNEVKLMEGAEEAIKGLKDEGFEIAVISGSFDLIANPLKDKLNLDHVFTNSLLEKDGLLTGEVEGPLVEGTKADVLVNLIEEQDISLDECVAVGDGANDISMIEIAKYGIAFNAKPAVKEIADIIIENNDLKEVLFFINNLNADSDELEESTELTEEIAEDTEDISSEDVASEAAEVVSSEDVASEAAEVVSSEDVASEDVASEDVASEAVSSEDVALEDNEDATSEVAENVSAEAVETTSSEDVTSEESGKTSEEETEKVSEDKKGSKSKNKKSKKNQLPEVDFDVATTPEGVRQQKDEREALISKIADEREEFNKVAKEHRKIRDELNDSLKENLKLAIDFRDKRNEINKDVEASKKLRDEVNEELKKLEWSSGRRDRLKLENEIKKIDKVIETRVLDIKKENQLVKNANDLRKQLMEIKEDEKVKDAAQDLKKVSEEHHAKVVEFSEQAQEFHENMLNYFRKTDEIRTTADEAHKKFIEARKAASSKHEEFKIVLSEIHVINKALGTNKSKRRRSEKQSNTKKNREEKEKAEDIFEKFKQGKKLSTEELLLLQKHNIG
ncbi:phosphoserine phosphatase [Methanobrevibacter cuticularis]|uniref:phosphoserine phosphatase n=1 Tax=Methanobrevibacter cuticularis TaxID=47311 RepID=A0A166EKA1_9EURY|nr:phosphoserine phosphatase SerB [Methanobrevibacter cuticularis]KZX16750.1 phosphoserine phosphatase [Methanobrevibacter cuticularis]